jgi:hypothetical protein
VVLVEPLVSMPTRLALDERLAVAARRDPRFVAVVFAGAIADVVGTLPPDDRWRTLTLPRSPLSARSEPAGAARPPFVPRRRLGGFGEPTSGLAPPSWPSGRPFGTWKDGQDLAELVMGSPGRDPAFVPLADGLAPGAARVLVAAFGGWRSALDEAQALLDRTASHTGLVDALRWACWRRRAYGVVPAEDVWPYESLHHWAQRAFDLLERGVEPDTETIARDIGWHRIAP